MSFEIIPTEQTQFSVDKVQVIIDHAQGECGPDATVNDLDSVIARLILPAICNPKRPATVRAHLVQYWPIIAPMAGRSPESFDFILTEFAERISELG
jgi:hypothetical protein